MEYPNVLSEFHFSLNKEFPDELKFIGELTVVETF
jgi:hypothetical protein